MSESRVAMTATPAGGAARSGVSAIPSLSYLSAGSSPVGEEGGGMALEMDPERRRRLLAVDEATRAWRKRHGITNSEWAEDASASGAGGPTPEQVEELERELRVISGQDPETGLYLS
jgi:hypothetical protein